MLAGETAIYRDRPVPRVAATSTQVGFSQVALLRVLNHVQQPERDWWITRYRGIETTVDAALFMVDAKLKLRHDIDPPALGAPG